MTAPDRAWAGPGRRPLRCHGSRGDHRWGGPVPAGLFDPERGAEALVGGRGVVEQALGFVVAPQRPGQRRTRPEPPASSLRGFRAHGLWSGIGAPLPEAGLAMAHDWDCSDRAGRGRIAAGQRYLARLDQRRRAWLYHRRFSYGPFSSCRPINPTNLSRRRSSWLQIPPRDDRHGGDRPRHAHAMSL